MKAVILAGGYGKRLKSINKDIPKPMTVICEKTVLEHQISVLKNEGITDFIFITGYLGDKISDYFNDGKKFGVNITYFIETEPLGTAGALFRLNLTEDFLLCNGDLIFNFSLKKMIHYHKSKNALATLFTHPNNHPYDSTLVCANNDGCITKFIKESVRDGYCQNLCNAGIQIISPELIKLFSFDRAADLDKDVLMPTVHTGRIYSYKSPEYVRDMGTPERLSSVERDLNQGIVELRHIKYKQKAIFLDRDGTVNKHKGYITKPEDLELLKGIPEAINIFHDLGYLVIIVTNQPVIARGECTTDDLKKIHNRLETLLGEKGAFIDEIYYCPHHPDKGFPGEIEELKIKCDCRKPEPGLLFKASDDFNIDLSKSYMVGDSERDIKAGKKAGCKVVSIGEFCEELYNESDMNAHNVYDFALQLQDINLRKENIHNSQN